MENIIKQGYLKKGNTGVNVLSGIFRRDAQKWFVFTIRGGIPYLEYYDSDVSVFNQRPINSYCLSQCQNIRAMDRTPPPTIHIICADRYIELVASSRAQMMDWKNSIETSLIRLNIMKKETEGNVYSVLPAVVRQPRVSQEVLEEREASSAQAAASSSAPDQATGAPSSFEPTTSSDSAVTASLPELSGFTGEDIPPPVPRRPPLFEQRSNIDESALSNDSTLSSDGSLSNDFVSMDVHMSNKEVQSILRRSSLKRERGVTGNDTSARTGVKAQRSVSVFSYFPLNGEEMNLIDDQPVATSNLETSHHGDPELDNSDSSSSEEMSYLMDIASLGLPASGSGVFTHDLIGGQESEESNAYSLFPGTSNIALETMSNSQPTSRPVPLPRHGLSLRKDYDNVSAGDTSQSSLGANKFLNPVKESSSEVEWASWNGNSVLDGAGSNAGDASTFCLRPYKEETPATSSLLKDSKDADGNLYSPVLNKDGCHPPFSKAPPIPYSSNAPPIPPFPTPCDVMLQQDPFRSEDFDFFGIYRTHVSSIPVSNNSSKPLSTAAGMSENDAFNSHQLSSPPVPLPRRKAAILSRPEASAFMNESSNLMHDIPPIPPRRGSPQLPTANRMDADMPPSLPSRKLQNFIIRRPKSFSSQSRVDEVEPPPARTLPPVPSGENSDATTQHGAAASVIGRPSGLSHKMRLDRAHSIHTVVSLKQTQVEILQNEIDLPNITVTLTQKSGHGLALVDWNGMPCIAGWNQMNFPTLHGKLHIGDIILSVNNVPAASPEVTQKLLRLPVTSKIEVLLKRMPYAKVFAIRRNAEGQSLGLKREGGTGEIVYVDPNSLAAQHGLTPYAQSGLAGNRCNWFLTEINSRPLSLFFKEMEIDHRLCAVGREISIVVQPSEFIFEIRRQLKKLKNHKSFIVQ